MRARGQTKYLMFVLLFVSLITVNSNVASAQTTGTLKFKSGFEAGVTITHRGDGQRSDLSGADLYGYDWDDFNNFFNYVAESSYPEHVNTYLDSSKAHTGNRSLYMEQTDWYDPPGAAPTRNALKVWMHDADDGGSMLDYMRKVYVSRWIYYPNTLDLKDNDGWMVIASSREVGVYQGADFSVVLLIYKSGGELYWYVKAVAYTSPHTYFWTESNHDVPVPLGEWFQLETYIERDQTNGVFQMWVNGFSVFDITGEKTSFRNVGSHFMKLTSVMSQIKGADEEDFPLYQWVDDIEIWNGMPSEEEKVYEQFWADGFESGNLAAWDGTQTAESGLFPTIVSNPVYQGSYAANFSTSSGAIGSYSRAMHAIQDPIGVTEVYQRSFVRYATLPDANDTNIWALRFAAESGSWIASAGVLRLNENYYWYIREARQTSNFTMDSSIEIDIWFAMEFYFNATTNGKAILWVNDVKKCEMTGDFSGVGKIAAVYPYIYLGGGLDDRGNHTSAKTLYHDSFRVDRVRIGYGAPMAFQASAYSLTGVEDEPVGFSPLEGVRINGTRLTDASGRYEWANLAYNTVYTFVIEKPADCYLAWVLNVEGSYSWNGTHYILRHNATETQEGPIEIYFSRTEEVNIRSSTDKLTSVYHNSSSQNPHTFLRFNIAADIGVTSQLEIYTADEGHPRPFKIEGATDWSYDSESKILTVWILHTSVEEAEIEWRGAAMGQ